MIGRALVVHELEDDLGKGKTLYIIILNAVRNFQLYLWKEFVV